MRAWATAAGVQRAVAQRDEPERTQRRSVAGGTSIRRATSAAVTSAMTAWTLAGPAARK